MFYYSYVLQLREGVGSDAQGQIFSLGNVSANPTESVTVHK